MASGWKTDPTPHQQQWYEDLSDVHFDTYEPYSSDGLQILRRKVGYAIFNPPDEVPSDSNGQTGYSKDKFMAIKEVVDCILVLNKKAEYEKLKKLNMSIVFVYVDYNDLLLKFAVFRVFTSESTWKFVDTSCRVYPSWKNFLDTNEMPPGKCCWPTGGLYYSNADGKVNLGWGITPAETTVKKALDATDRRSTWASFGATAVFLASMVTPVAAPVLVVAGTVATAAGAYTTLRSVTTLADRSAHQQTVNPFRNWQAAGSWLSVAGSAAGMTAGAMTNRAATLARNGQVMGTAGRLTCNALNVTSLVVNGTGIGFGLYSIKERYDAGELTRLDVFQFSASVLFFVHATVNFQTASSIIQNTQKGVIEDFDQSLRSNRHRKQFRKLARNTAAEADSAMVGNAKVIRSIRNINNKDDFFAGMVRTRKDLSRQRVVFSEKGNIVVNDGGEIHPMKLYKMGKQQRQQFLSMAGDAARGTVPEATFMSDLQSVVNTKHSSTAKNTACESNELLEAEITLSSQLQQQIPCFSIGVTEVRFLIEVVNELTTKICSNTDNKYARWWQLIWNHVSSLVKEMMQSYGDAKQIAIELDKFCNAKSFNAAQGIYVSNLFVQFVINVFEQYKNHVDKLISDIKDERRRCAGL